MNEDLSDHGHRPPITRAQPVTALHPYGDPCGWSEIPDAWTKEFAAALAAHGHTVTEAHDSAIIIDVPGLPEGHEWHISVPSAHGRWFWCIADESGHCSRPRWIDAAVADPQALADAVAQLLHQRSNSTAQP